MSDSSAPSWTQVLGLSSRAVVASGALVLGAVGLTSALDRAGLLEWSAGFWPAPYLLGALIAKGMLRIVPWLPFDPYRLEGAARERMALTPVFGAIAGGIPATMVSFVLLDGNYTSPFQSPVASAAIAVVATLTAGLFTASEARRLLNLGVPAGRV